MTSTIGEVTGRPTLGGLAVGTVKSLVVDTIVAAAVMAVLSLVWAWVTYEKNVESEEERRLRKLFGDKVTPGVKKALEVHAHEAEQMTNDSPEFPVYANVTVELEESWTESGIAGNPSEKNITNARFVDLGVSFKKVSKEETINTDNFGTTYFATKLVTYSVEVDFGETEAEHHWRKLLHDATRVVRGGRSAESVAEHTQWGGTDLKAWEKPMSSAGSGASRRSRSSARTTSGNSGCWPTSNTRRSTAPTNSTSPRCVTSRRSGAVPVPSPACP